MSSKFAEYSLSLILTLKFFSWSQAEYTVQNIFRANTPSKENYYMVVPRMFTIIYS